MLDDWQELSLEQLIRKDRPLTYGIVQPGDFVQTGFKMIRSGDYSDGWISFDSVASVALEIARPYERSRVRAGDLLMTVVGANTGLVTRVPDELDGANISRASARIAVDDSIACSGYVEQYLKSHHWANQIYSSIKAGAQPVVHLGDLGKFRLRVPRERATQKAIASILQTWDEAIAACARLIASKQRRLVAVRQRLFAATRPGADPDRAETWDETTLGEVFTEIGELNPGLGPNAVITVGKYAIRRQVEHFTRSVASANLGNYQLLTPGDFVYDPMSAYYGAIGRYAGDALGIVSPAYTVIRLADGINPSFVEALLKSHYVAFELENRSSQGNREGKRRILRSDEFSSIPFMLPPRAEQDRIAAALGEIGRDLELTTKSHDALKKQKRGLMQKLLTGEWRAKVDKEAAHG